MGKYIVYYLVKKIFLLLELSYQRFIVLYLFLFVLHLIITVFIIIYMSTYFISIFIFPQSVLVFLSFIRKNLS